MSIAADAIARDTAAMQALLEKQRAAFTAELPVSAAIRKDRLQRALKLMLEHREAFKKALSDDPADAKPEQKDAEFPAKQLNETASSAETAKQKDKDQA